MRTAWTMSCGTRESCCSGWCTCGGVSSTRTRPVAGMSGAIRMRRGGAHRGQHPGQLRGPSRRVASRRSPHGERRASSEPFSSRVRARGRACQTLGPQPDSLVMSVQTRQFPAGFDWRSRFPAAAPVLQAEGGAVYVAEDPSAKRCFTISDEGTLADFDLDDDVALVTVTEYTGRDRLRQWVQ